MKYLILSVIVCAVLVALFIIFSIIVVVPKNKEYRARCEDRNGTVVLARDKTFCIKNDAIIKIDLKKE